MELRLAERHRVAFEEGKSTVEPSDGAAMFRMLSGFHERPAPFSRHTTGDLWTDPHVSKQMLAFHLNSDSDLASRRPALIEGTVDWLDRRLNLSGKAVCDLGCGPGLYATRMAARGAAVTGVDFSSGSLDHAAEHARRAGLSIDWILGDYLDCPLPSDQDLICLIYNDVCALSPDRRRTLFDRIRAALAPGGHFVCDSHATAQYAARVEETVYGRRLMDGFWADGDYFGFLATFRYDALQLALDRYLIVEPRRVREIFNWLQYFDPAALCQEIAAGGFETVAVVDALTGDPWVEPAREFAVVARAV